jgi:hypothetical protein
MSVSLILVVDRSNLKYPEILRSPKIFALRHSSRISFGAAPLTRHGLLQFTDKSLLPVKTEAGTHLPA